MTHDRNIACMLLIALMALPVCGQQKRHEAAAQGADCNRLQDLESSADADYRATRVILDAGTHQRWLLERNVSRPAFPARLIPVSGELSCARFGFEESGHRSTSNPKRPLLPVIRAGDSLILVEHTRVSDARFEGIALSTGAAGEAIQVRLKIGGRTLIAIPTAPGRAMLLTEDGEVRR